MSVPKSLGAEWQIAFSSLLTLEPITMLGRTDKDCAIAIRHAEAALQLVLREIERYGKELDRTGSISRG